MDAMEAEALLQTQREFFATGATLDVEYRIQALKKLKDGMDRFAPALYDALREDLGKSPSESYMCELGLVKSEISFLLRHVRSYARERRVRTPLAQYVSRSYVKPSPYGSVLIMSPWNYPVLLTLDPLADTLAAGNTAIVKPSAYSPHVSQVLKDLLERLFPPEYVAVVTGGRQENRCLLELDVDYIFFTGSPSVGREVMAHAAEHLTPVTLELGGKSPCIVDDTADLALAARRIVFGKFVNCGQTCVAPDYIYCDAKVKDALVHELEKQIAVQYGQDPLSDPTYGKIVNRKHFDRLLGLLDRDKAAVGGRSDPATLRIAPTVLDNVDWTDPVMGEEIFGPILPVLTYDTLDRAVAKLQSLPHPLALYLFSSSRENIKTVTARLSFGGGCINDTLIHLATSAMGFGGVGRSGMGAYHGRRGFETFSHFKSMVDKKTFLDLPMRYRPYTARKDKLISTFVK